MFEQPDGIERRAVRVADIEEYPTALENRCLLLRQLGLDTYRCTDEELLDALNESAKHPENLDICKNNSRCGAFWDKLQQGVTPFFERDPIRLEEYNGRYWVNEGKHRVCMAKRCGAERIDAYVWKLGEDERTLLPVIGNAGHYSFRCEYSPKGLRRAKGDIAVLWVQSPHDYPASRFDFGPIALDTRLSTQGKLHTVFPGLSYSVTASHECSMPFGLKKRYIIQSDVAIEPGHTRTRIWLMRGLTENVLVRPPVEVSQISTEYRFGCWRNHHLRHSAIYRP